MSGSPIGRRALASKTPAETTSARSVHASVRRRGSAEATLGASSCVAVTSISVHGRGGQANHARPPLWTCAAPYWLQLLLAGPDELTALDVWNAVQVSLNAPFTNVPSAKT